MSVASDGKGLPAGACSVTVTPTMFLGPAEAAASREHLIPVTTARDAVTVIKSGHRALLPAGAWDEAAAVLRIFGANEKWIEFKLAMSGRAARDQRSGCDSHH